MADASEPPSPWCETVIDDLMDRWEDAAESGRRLNAEDLCVDHPECIDEVRSRIARLEAIDGRIGRGLMTEDRSSHSLPLATTIDQLCFVQKGGLGSVYVGQDVAAHRSVAIKFLHRHLSSDPICRDRFLLEAEVTARLEHPGVIPLYGVGETADGDPFYAMRFIDGGSMDQAIESLHRDDCSGASTGSDGTGRGPSRHRRVELDRRYRTLLNHFVSVSQTIAYAHNRGIVHRDVKPANVMLGRYGETIVVDWGLAVPVVREGKFRQSGEATLMPATSSDSSTSGQGAGTPAYMSPEQASRLAPTPAGDIYSLGATLYKIVSGATAVDGDSIDEIRTKVIDGRITPVQRKHPSVPPPLASIIAKAMSLRPSDRYETALALARDVEAYLADEPVAAHSEGWGSRMLRTARRHRSATQTAIIALAVGGLLGTIGFLMLGAYAARETKARREAQSMQSRAERLGRESLAASAGFLSKSIAGEIDLRWRILESEAASPKLRQHVSELNESLQRHREVHSLGPLDRVDSDQLGPAQDQLQIWLYDRFAEHSEAVKTESWFVNSADGTQVARAPRGDSIGDNFRHRDYFTGLGRDLSPETLRAMDPMPTPLANAIVHMCEVYESTTTGTLKVSFSVPIFDAESEQPGRKRIGVLSTSVELGDFAMGDDAWLVDTRLDRFDQQRGLLLQHPKLGQRSGDDFLPHLAPEFVQRAMQLRRSRRDFNGFAALDDADTVMTTRDPIDGSVVQVAIEPVVIRGRSASIADTGWIVVVREER